MVKAKMGSANLCSRLLVSMSMSMLASEPVSFLARGVPGRWLYLDSVHVLGDQVDRHCDGLALLMK
jgi:hypothetical protein